MSSRLLQPADLPEMLWVSAEQSLILPKILSLVYINMLRSKGLYEMALESNTDEGPVGGLSEEDTKRHFARRFTGSTARTQLAILDPKNELNNASDLFVKTFSGGTVGLLDIPSGAGAATIDLLTTIAVLRQQEILPRQPLYIKLLCGDISESARSYASEMLENIMDFLNRESIYVDEKSVNWDVCDAESTTNILHAWMTHAPNCQNYFVIMANFSGFLQTNGKLKEAKLQLEEIFRWAATRRSIVVWLEPQTNEVINNFMPRIIKWISEKIPKIFRSSSNPTPKEQQSSCLCKHPLKGTTYRVSANLIRLEVSN